MIYHFKTSTLVIYRYRTIESCGKFHLLVTIVLSLFLFRYCIKISFSSEQKVHQFIDRLNAFDLDLGR